MQEGSIIIMTKDMEANERHAYKLVTGVEPPTPSETYLMIVAVESDKNVLAGMEYGLQRKVELAIYLDTHPRYQEMKLPLDAKFFTELLPGGNNVLKEIESLEIRKPVLVEC